jgi:signal transduction histidine kinase
MVALAAVVLAFLAGRPEAAPEHLAAWLLASLVAEVLWLETITEQGTMSLASALNFAAIFTLDPASAVWVVVVSVLVATAVIQRRPALRVLFGAAQIAVVVYVSAAVYELLGGPRPTLDHLLDPAYLPPMLATFVTFFLLNTMAVSGAIALDQQQRLLDVWRKNFAYRDEVLSNLALFAMSPLVVIVYLALGWVGFALVMVPLVIFRNATRRYITLERTQESVVHAERLAAKGEMAAEIAHELNNSLAALRGNAQLLERRIAEGSTERARDRTTLIQEQVDRMSVLTRGLLDFAHRNVRLQDTDLTALIERTVAFVRPQNRFDGIDIDLSLDNDAGSITVDPGQIQQVVLNLLFNAADAVRARGEGRGGVYVTLRHIPAEGEIQLVVADEGVGIEERLIRRIFEPTFTTKESGHGFGLSTCERIVHNHSGRISVESEVGVGSRFEVRLPLATQSRRRSSSRTRAT